jgi:hypothetical protein
MEYTPPSVCPVCGTGLRVVRVACPNCKTELSGSFMPCKYCALNERLKLFMEAFLRCRGNIRDVEKELSISYPTVRGLLDELVATLFSEEKVQGATTSTARILDMLEKKEITAAEAAEMLKGSKQPD